MQCFAKRGKREPHEFKMLTTERNSDNRDAEEQSEEEMCNSNPYSAKYNPKDVHDRIEAPGAAW